MLDPVIWGNVDAAIDFFFYGFVLKLIDPSEIEDVALWHRELTAGGSDWMWLQGSTWRKVTTTWQIPVRKDPPALRWHWSQDLLTPSTVFPNKHEIVPSYPKAQNVPALIWGKKKSPTIPLLFSL